MNGSTATPGARLVLRSGDDIREHDLRKTTQYLGREQSNDIVLTDDEQVSGRHLRVLVRAGSFYVEDIGSTNGTFLNGERITGAVLLNSGDLIKAGKTILKFLSGDDGDGSRPGAAAGRMPGQPGSGSDPDRKTRIALNLSDVRFNLGLVYFKKGDYARAIETWEKELDRGPDERLTSWIGKAKACLADAGSG